MSRVLISAQTGASVHVFAADHCPPHVHARHRGDGWTARVRFSFITDHVGVMSVTPLNREPRPSVIGALVREVHQRLLACRQAWWAMHRNPCLTNKWAAARDTVLHVLDGPEQGARQIAQAHYDPLHNQIHISFLDATSLIIQAGTGLEP